MRQELLLSLVLDEKNFGPEQLINVLRNTQHLVQPESSPRRTGSRTQASNHEVLLPLKQGFYDNIKGNKVFVAMLLKPPDNAGRLHECICTNCVPSCGKLGMYFSGLASGILVQMMDLWVVWFLFLYVLLPFTPPAGPKSRLGIGGQKVSLNLNAV